MANTGSTEPIGRYCASVAESAVHYTNKQTEWTPNNIKRLIISPDMVIVQLHTHTTFIKKQFQPNKYAQCIYDPKYKTMVSVLGSTGNNVCSHVEEIIYCLQGVSGGCLHSSEADLRAIVSSSKVSASQEQLVKIIGDRFKRLYGVVYFQGNIQQLVNSYGNRMLKDAEFHVADETSGISSVLIHKNDWYKGYFFRPATYPADSESGLLYRKLHKLEVDIDAKISKAKSDAARESYLGELRVKAEKEVGMFKGVFTCCQRVGIMALKKDTSSWVSKTYLSNMDSSFKNITSFRGVSIVDVLDLFTSGNKESMKRMGMQFLESKGDKKEELSNFITTIHACTLKMYENLLRCYSQVINTLNSSFPTMVGVFLKEKTCKIKLLSSINMNVRVEFTDAPIKTSIINLCDQITGIILGDDLRSKYSSTQYWTEYFEKAVK